MAAVDVLVGEHHQPRVGQLAHGGGWGSCRAGCPDAQQLVGFLVLQHRHGTPRTLRNLPLTG